MTTLRDFGFTLPFVRKGFKEQVTLTRRQSSAVAEEVPTMAFKKIENNIEFWKPTTKNDERLGVVVEEREHPKYGRSVVLKGDKGDLIGLPSHTALQSLLKTVKRGDRVKVVYLGEEENDAGTKYRNYEVFIDE